MKANKDINTIVDSLANAIIDTPFLSIMIADQGLNIVWHNKRFAEDFSKGENLVGMKCWQVTGAKAQHKDCPTQASLFKRKSTTGFLDFGDRNFFFITVPVGQGYAAKIHAFLPKRADNHIIEK